MSNCVQCPPPGQCSCSGGTTCVLVGRSCNSCGQFVCQPSGNGGSNGSSAGATAGQAVGGVLAALILAFLIYWFWWRRRQRQYANRPHLPISPMANSPGFLSTPLRRHPSAAGSQPRSNARVKFGADTKMSAPAPRRSRLMPKASVDSDKLSVAEEDEKGLPEDPFDDKHSSAALGDGETPDMLQTMLESDSTRVTSQASSDFSFRSSHSTTIIPIAYIPAHSNSMSIEDGLERGAFGESKRTSVVGRQPSRLSQRLTALGSTLLPKIVSPQDPETLEAGTPSPVASDKAKPTRPDRGGLDLRLPKVSGPSSAPGFGVVSSPSPTTKAPNQRQSGFPWSAGQSEQPLSANTDSRFSSSTVNTLGYDSSSHSLGVPPPMPSATRNPRASDSTMSVISHMSYILDPPQIMTANPINRVVGTAQARTVQLPSSSAAQSTPSTPGVVEVVRSASLKRGPARNEVVSNAISLDIDPFADEASAVASRFVAGGHDDRASYAESTPADVTLEIDTTFSQAPHPTPITAQSATFSSHKSHDSTQSDMSIFTSSSRPITMMTENSRHISVASSNQRDSILDAMPFVPPPSSSSSPLNKSRLALQSRSPSSPSFPFPPPSPVKHDYQHDPFADRHDSLAVSDAATMGDLSPRSSHANRYSEASSVRTGHQSILDDVPFQLGFNRNSAWSATDPRMSQASQMTAGRSSLAYDRSGVFVEGSEVPPVPAISQEHIAQDVLVRPASDLSEEERLKTPVLDQADTFSPPTATSAADPRASVDSFTQAALLASRFAAGADE